MFKVHFEAVLRPKSRSLAQSSTLHAMIDSSSFTSASPRGRHLAGVILDLEFDNTPQRFYRVFQEECCKFYYQRVLRFLGSHRCAMTQMKAECGANCSPFSDVVSSSHHNSHNSITRRKNHRGGITSHAWMHLNDISNVTKERPMSFLPIISL